MHRMMLSDEMIQKIKDMLEPVFQKIGAAAVNKKIAMAIAFAKSQPTVEIVLDGKSATAIAVDIATVFSPEGDYRTVYTDDGKCYTVERIQALSLVILGEEDIRLCKATYDATPMNPFEDSTFMNERYWTTAVEYLTEEYIC